MRDYNKPWYSPFTFSFAGMFLVVVVAGLVTFVQVIVYDGNQSWTPLWSGTCTGAWTEQKEINNETKEETVKSWLAVKCGEDDVALSSNQTIDYFRLDAPTINCNKSQGNYSNRIKWECEVV